jgi:hypothetical protein
MERGKRKERIRGKRAEFIDCGRTWWDGLIGSVEGKVQKGYGVWESQVKVPVVYRRKGSKGYGLWESQVKVPIVYRQKGLKGLFAVGKPGKSACCL